MVVLQLLRPATLSASALKPPQHCLTVSLMLQDPFADLLVELKPAVFLSEEFLRMGKRLVGRRGACESACAVLGGHELLT